VPDDPRKPLPARWPGFTNDDADALAACVDLIGRSGATEFGVGCMRPEMPFHKQGWWAHAMYDGSRRTVEEQKGPLQAAQALARAVVEGGTCRRCGNMITIALAVGKCQWRREGRKYVPGCGKPVDESILPIEKRRST
jgi:hypothetical protein